MTEAPSPIDLSKPKIESSIRRINRVVRKIYKWIFRLLIAATTIWGGYEVWNSAIEHWNRPKLYAGIIPIYEMNNEKMKIEKIGAYDFENEFKFDKEMLAFPLEKLDEAMKKVDETLQKNRKIKGRSCELRGKKGRKYDLTIVVENEGKNNSRNFEIMVSFGDIERILEKLKKPSKLADSRIKVLDFYVEDMEPKEICADWRFYNPQPGEKYKAALLNKNLNLDYESIGLVENTVSAKGELEGESFTIMHVQLFAPNEVKKMLIRYQIDSEQKYFEDSTTGQFVYLF